MVRKFLIALVIWLLVAVVLELIGNALKGDVGVFLANNNVLLGFIAGVLYFLFDDDRLLGR